jgi:hypothetical protein
VTIVPLSVCGFSRFTWETRWGSSRTAIYTSTLTIRIVRVGPESSASLRPRERQALLLWRFRPFPSHPAHKERGSTPSEPARNSHLGSAPAWGLVLSGPRAGSILALEVPSSSRTFRASPPRHTAYSDPGPGELPEPQSTTTPSVINVMPTTSCR